MTTLKQEAENILFSQNKAIYEEIATNCDLMIAEFNQYAHSIRNLSWVLRNEGYPVAINATDQSFSIRHNFLGAQKSQCFVKCHEGDLEDMKTLYVNIKKIAGLYQ